MSRSMPAVARLRAPAAPAAPVEPARRTVSRSRARLRLFYPLGLIAAVAAVLILLVGASGPAAPATGAARIVPGDALAYIHLSTDPGRGPVKDALALANRLPGFPVLAAGVRARLDGVLGGPDVGPWLGNEAALALVSSSPSSADMLFVLSVRSLPRARAFMSRVAAAGSESYRGVRVLALASGPRIALLPRRWVVAGTEFAVRSAIDTARGAGSSLAASPAYRRASSDEPAGRALDAYVSAAGVHRLLVGARGMRGALGTLLDRPALAGVAISLSAAHGRVRVHVHTAVDATGAAIDRTRPASFTPSLQNVLPSGSTLMLDVAHLPAVAPRLLSAAATGGVAGRVAPLLSRLGAALSSEGVDMPKVLSLFDDETALAVGPAGTGAAPLILVSRVRDAAAARVQLAALEGPLSQLFAPGASGGGQAPLLNDRQLGATTVHELSLGPGLQIDYAVSRDLVIIATSFSGVSSVLERVHALGSDPAYRASVPGSPRGVSSLVFFDLRQLLGLGEQTGLLRSARYQALRPDLEQVHAVSLESKSEGSDSTVELLLQIS